MCTVLLPPGGNPIAVNKYIISDNTTYNIVRRSQWPRGLRRRSAVARLLRLWVRISPGTWMSVCCVCCQVEVSATSWSLVQRNPTDCGASLCVIEKPLERGGPGPLGAVEPKQTNKQYPTRRLRTESDGSHATGKILLPVFLLLPELRSMLILLHCWWFK
jgi:hypothetical protein